MRSAWQAIADARSQHPRLAAARGVRKHAGATQAWAVSVMARPSALAARRGRDGPAPCQPLHACPAGAGAQLRSNRWVNT
jgi:hypothetical protein